MHDSLSKFRCIGGILCITLLIIMPTGVLARGVTLYLPLNMSPEIERQIERVLIFAGKPIMTRPIPVAMVEDALAEASKVDESLCERVRYYLRRYTLGANLTLLRTEIAVASGSSESILPNQHGMRVDSSWNVSAEGYYQPSNYALLNLGGVAYDGRATPTGSILSLGFEYAQMDVGYRDHWLSPFTDSSMLIGTEAATMPSITLSNYKPISSLGLSYQLYLAEMSKSDHIIIKSEKKFISGHPRIGGIHLQMEPFPYSAFSVNRQFQFGGGRSHSSFSDFIKAFRNAYSYDIVGDTVTKDTQFGNEQASITSQILFPGKFPFSTYFEYAAEDFSRDNNSIHLGSSSLSFGIDFPRIISDRFDLIYETTEWQDRWYLHDIYQDGLTNYGIVIGHWFGDQRRSQDGAGGRSHMLRLGWQGREGNYVSFIYRTLKNDSFTTIAYKRMQELGLTYSFPWSGHSLDAELYAGNDVFGDRYVRLSTSINFNQDWMTISSETAASSGPDSEMEYSVVAGMNYSTFNSDEYEYTPIGKLKYNNLENKNIHLGIGAMRSVSEHGDLGAGIEWDRISGQNLYSVRMMDYRYRIGAHFAVNGFFGIGLFETKTSALGYYYGAGAQVVNIMPKLDLCVDMRRIKDMSRLKLAANEAPHYRVFYNFKGVTFYLRRRF